MSQPPLKGVASAGGLNRGHLPALPFLSPHFISPRVSPVFGGVPPCFLGGRGLLWGLTGFFEREGFEDPGAFPQPFRALPPRWFWGSRTLEGGRGAGMDPRGGAGVGGPTVLGG